MASESLNGLKIAILITDGFEQVEMTEPRKALDDAGAETKIVSPKEERVKAWKFTQWGDEFPVDVSLSSARASTGSDRSRPKTLCPSFFNTKMK